MMRRVLPLVLLTASVPVRAGEPGSKSVTLEAESGLRYDDNVFVDRRGQFGAAPVAHLVGLLSGRASGTVSVRRWLDLSLDVDVATEELRFDLSEPGRTDDLRKTTTSFEPGLEFHGENLYLVSVTVPITVVRENQAEWSFFQVGPRLGGTYYGPRGLILDGAYTFTGKFFDLDDPSETYGNIDLMSHRAELSLKWWFHKLFRLQLTSSYEYQTYDDNIGVLLARILFLPISEYENPDAVPEPVERRDHRVEAELEGLVVPFEWGALALGYRYEQDWSNLDAFTYVGHGPRLALAFKHGRHEGFAQVKLTLKDFYDFRFDTRYLDTRKDYKIDAYVVYGFRIASWVRMDVRYSFLRNDSNDADHFAFGHSRSYSRYQRNKIELTFTFSTDVLQTGHQGPADELPGTLMAAAGRL